MTRAALTIRPHGAAVVLAWLLAVGAGLGSLWAYSGTPGPSGGGARRWPHDASFAKDLLRPTLVVFLHPQCACSRATIAELSRLVAATPDRAAIHAVFYRPSDAAPGWERTDLWTTAAAIPGVQVMSDDDGAQARAFGSQVSGQTLLYAPEGALLFSGGITAARGHEGDSAGRASLTALLIHQQGGRTSTPVFGCLLRGTAPRGLAGGDGAKL